MVMKMIKVKWKEGPLPHFKLKAPIFRFRKKRIPHLVPVSVEHHQNIPSIDERLYDALYRQNYYVTPYVKCGRVIVDLALIPYQIAIIKLKDTKSNLKAEKILRKKGWDVVFYSDEELERDFYEVIRRVNHAARAYLHVLNET